MTTIKGLHTSLYQKKDDIFHGPGALVCHVGTVVLRVLLKVLDDLERQSALEQVMLRQRVLLRGLGGADCDVIYCSSPNSYLLAVQNCLDARALYQLAEAEFLGPQPNSDNHLRVVAPPPHNRASFRLHAS